MMHNEGALCNSCQKYPLLLQISHMTCIIAAVRLRKWWWTGEILKKPTVYWHSLDNLPRVICCIESYVKLCKDWFQMVNKALFSLFFFFIFGKVTNMMKQFGLVSCVSSITFRVTM